MIDGIQNRKERREGEDVSGREGKRSVIAHFHSFMIQIKETRGEQEKRSINVLLSNTQKLQMKVKIEEEGERERGSKIIVA